MFTLDRETKDGRRGRMKTAHGTLNTPAFMPVATAGAMKGITHEDLQTLGAEILLCNSYHLHLQPGEAIVREAGGLHSFIGWDGPMLTDSGGFQVFSLRGISAIGDEGVRFQSHLNGDPLFLGPQESMDIQHTLGADIIMCFDQCPPSTAKRAEIQAAVDRTLTWANACKKAHEQHRSSTGSSQMLFGIVQGGLERDLREKCAAELTAMGFDGYAVGGLAVGETPEEMYGVLDAVCPLLPKEAPRYLMGVGRLDQLRESVRRGVDMFDCVLPMREARHGTVYLGNGQKIRIMKSEYLHDHGVLDPESPSPLSRTHKKSFLCHLLRAHERLGEKIACMQNLGVTLETMRTVQKRIAE
ncbi:tRNA guanosine(34) transglycosylase Tgt [Candidatus Peregrinibacteria bacterium]|nr:tRNA guanosine(34) transglycosylase Tgt [Candidatus Peregrinibacteria bacterium]